MEPFENKYSMLLTVRAYNIGSLNTNLARGNFWIRQK